MFIKFHAFQFVCMGGSTNRMKQFAKFIQNELQGHLNNNKATEPKNFSRSDRYVLYKVGPVLAVNVSTSLNVFVHLIIH